MKTCLDGTLKQCGMVGNFSPQRMTVSNDKTQWNVVRQ